MGRIPGFTKCFILVRMIFSRGILPNFQGILCRGFGIEVEAGKSIRQVCRQDLGIAEGFLEEEVRAVFLDGRPVDDLDTAIVQDGSQIALSGSLPGLAGISMRRGSPIVSFRSEISYKEVDRMGEVKRGRVTLKLFNLVADKLGPALLERGIILEGTVWQEFLEKQPQGFWQGIDKVEIDGAGVSLSVFQKYSWSNSMIRLFVEAE